MNFRRGVCLIALMSVAMVVRADAPPATPESIRRLIDRLGAPDFSQRELADAELRRLGLVAFDYLQEAVGHRDLEVRLRVRAILRSIKQQHLFADLDPALRRLLRNYSSLAPAERQQRVLELVTLLPQQGIDAVARLARFEEVESIAQVAALGLLASPLPRDADRQRSFAEQVTANLADSSTTAAQWLRLWAGTILDPATTLAGWQQVCSELHNSAGVTDVALLQVRDFTLRLAQLDAIVRAGQLDSADELVQALARDAKTDSVRELRWMSWLIERQLWSLVAEYQVQATNRLLGNPRLRYLIAEAQWEQGLVDDSERTARDAFDDNEQGSRLEVATWLDNERGRFDWAEREYRAAIADGPDDILRQFVAHERLAYMLHDIQRDDQAADVLASLIQMTEESDDLRKTLELNPRGIRELRARSHYYRALHAERQQDSATQHRELAKGFELHPGEIDLLIACFRLPEAPPDWHGQVRKAIESVARRYQQEIQMERQQLDRNPETHWENINASLAQTMNEYAWVIGNTEGDQQQALEYSKLSNEYVPGSPAFLDTLGRCYYAVGELDQAIKYQTLAWERAPFEEQIRRQLDLFLDARTRSDTHP